MKLKPSVFFTIKVSTSMHFDTHEAEVVNREWIVDSWEDYYTFSLELREFLSSLIED